LTFEIYLSFEYFEFSPLLHYIFFFIIMNSFIDQTIDSGVGTGAATAAKLAANFHLLQEQIESHLIQSHEVLHTFALDKWGVNIDLSSFYIILFTTFTILVTLPFIKVFAFSSKKNNKGEDITIETTDKEGYEEFIPAGSEKEATQPFEIEEPKQEKESSTPTESSNFEATQVIETELPSIDFADEEIPSAIQEAEQKEEEEEEEEPSDEEISANSSDEVEILLPEVNVVISESDSPSSPIISKKLLRQPLETSQSLTLSPRVSSRVRSQPERFSPRGKLLPTENVMGRSRKLNNNII
jgi:hypothetical protein